MPQVENVENYVLVWLDQSNGGKGKSGEVSKRQLQQVVNCVKIFLDPKACHEFMSNVKDVKIFVIVSGAVEEDFVSSIHDEKQLESIYVYSPGKVQESWFGEYQEITGIYTTIDALCEQLSKDVTRLDRTLLGFEMMERSKSKDGSNASQQEASFMYDQLFRDIVLSVKDEDMQDMYDFCQTRYHGNSNELSNLKDLKTTYSANTSIYWYTRDSFLYRMLNKALRTHDYDTLYTLRVYIRHLHQQIASEQGSKGIDVKKLYRGQAFEKDDFEQLSKTEKGLFSVSNFLSTTSDREVALGFARENLGNNRKVSTLFEITIEKTTAIPVTCVSGLSYYKLEKEWLFSMGSVFRVGKLKHSAEGIWIVPLTLTDDYDKRLTALKEHFKKSMEDSNVCLNFGRLMYQIAAWKKSDYFYREAIQVETSPQRLSVLYNNLGMVKDELDQYDEALRYYSKSLDLKKTEESGSAADDATTYNNIATLYWKMKKMDKAIEYYEKAIEDCNAQGNSNEGLVATLHTNMAGVLNEQGKHEEALERCQEALKINLKIFPEIHPRIATTYGTIANTMHRLKLYSKAVEYGEKAVDIDRSSLPKDHPQTLGHQNNLTVYKQAKEQAEMDNNQ
ncbi:unnamed protein product [Adineta ricciae]|uniref:ADP ribosyltransferase domain-containing protein n=2 Tax=Adineta ricciae TaxID=249248 RepID=A0A815BL02_ADIRI|nr:unnamed protein product [Adineta ricciae]